MIAAGRMKILLRGGLWFPDIVKYEVYGFLVVVKNSLRGLFRAKNVLKSLKKVCIKSNVERLWCRIPFCQ